MNAKANPSANSGVQIACKLTDEEQQRWEELSRKLFSGRERTNELEDGYEFVFPGEAEWATEVVRFVVLERECCPFFTFEMVFEPTFRRLSVQVEVFSVAWTSQLHHRSRFKTSTIWGSWPASSTRSASSRR